MMAGNVSLSIVKKWWKPTANHHSSFCKVYRPDKKPLDGRLRWGNRWPRDFYSEWSSTSGLWGKNWIPSSSLFWAGQTAWIHDAPRDGNCGALFDDQRNFTIFPAQVSILQSSINNNSQTYTLQSFYPLSRSQCLPGGIRFFRMKKENKQDKQINKPNHWLLIFFDSEGSGLTLAILVFYSWRSGYPIIMWFN